MPFIMGSFRAKLIVLSNVLNSFAFFVNKNFAKFFDFRILLAFFVGSNNLTK